MSSAIKRVVKAVPVNPQFFETYAVPNSQQKFFQSDIDHDDNPYEG